MSFWTHTSGIIVVSPWGRTQAEMRYILETILDHLPIVSGSEGNMKIHIVQQFGHDFSSSCNEFGENLWYRRDADHDGWMRMQSQYTLVLEGNLRDRQFDETKKELMNWLCRLAKRIEVDEILLRLNAYDQQLLITDAEPFCKMLEPPSWHSDNQSGEPAWAEYLMWDRAKNADLPMTLQYKYYNDPENDSEFERRAAYDRAK